VAPQSYRAWFEAGLYSKARRDWVRSVERNRRALEFFKPEDAERFDGMNPAAWNMGIAATAIGDWATARDGWRAFGINLDPGDEPVEMTNLGQVPIRINPERPGMAHQEPLTYGEVEVVWCWRLSPAHGVIANVPMPASGHRFRDVVLHDGVPAGSRVRDGEEVPVFDELVRLEESGIRTCQAQIRGAQLDDLKALADMLDSREMGLDDWSSMRILCAECSRGNPEADHRHQHTPGHESDRNVGLAGEPSELSAIIDRWLADRSQVEVVDLTLLCTASGPGTRRILPGRQVSASRSPSEGSPG
jgi:hypothetical protein